MIRSMRSWRPIGATPSRSTPPPRAPSSTLADRAGQGGGPIDAAVVGSGPNGLAAAPVLAGAGKSVRILPAGSTIRGGPPAPTPAPPRVLPHPRPLRPP